MTKKRIVILGGGFGGLSSALTLAEKLKKTPSENDYEIVLVDKNEYHTFTPLLYETATTSKATANYLKLKSLVTYPFKNLLEKTKVRFLKGEVLHIDLREGAVHLKSRKLKYEYLILALGAETNHFKIPGLQEYSLSLKSFADSLKIRDAILSLVESDVKNPKIVIGGAGATGVELASEIKEWTCKMREDIGKTCDAEVTLVDGGKTVLALFSPTVIKIATKRLQKIGVKVLTEKMIKEVKKKELIFKNGENIPFDIFIWTGGVKAASLTEQLPTKNDPRGRVEITGPLECIPEGPDLKFAGKIYVVGDIACFYDPKTENPVPQAARPAIVQGRIAAINIIEDIKKEKGLRKKVKHKNFRPRNYPYIVPIGGKFAVAKFGPFILPGFPGWILKGLVELNYFLSIMSFTEAMKVWLKGLWVFIRNDRLG